jgi:hypothetical protein
VGAVLLETFGQPIVSFFHRHILQFRSVTDLTEDARPM